jgi:hypothetical protein
MLSFLVARKRPSKDQASVPTPSLGASFESSTATEGSAKSLPADEEELAVAEAVAEAKGLNEDEIPPPPPPGEPPGEPRALRVVRWKVVPVVSSSPSRGGLAVYRARPGHAAWAGRSEGCVWGYCCTLCQAPNGFTSLTLWS